MSATRLYYFLLDDGPTPAVLHVGGVGSVEAKLSKPAKIELFNCIGLRALTCSKSLIRDEV